MQVGIDAGGLTLSGPRVRLRPMRRTDADALMLAASDGELWKVPFTIVPSAEMIDAYIDTALSGQATGLGLPFVTELVGTGDVVGSTRYWNIDARHRQVELSHVWVAASHQGTFVNREATYLMMKYAFEELGCIRVQVRCDEQNAKMSTFCKGIGATREALLRNERIMPDGRKRNTLVYGVTDEDWSFVRTKLERRLALD